ncbi:peptidase M20 domain-containing protein 2-like isoform X2 [Tachysurus fulvidraco]|uniref:peptidase M20 domain-containing protein 2-like isoform X2 n=1 Tax=Tachysurus fulvidraco TaxID=1234273 RepID=UPI001FED8D46|nr:peptidase M20 domain-containing protein 2-like isoform X2 [Tachysurus fulvidraco]
MNEKLQALKQLVCFSINEAKDKLHLLGDSIWRHPEVACEERQAHETLVRFFTQEKGWTVEAHYKLETAFRATWGPVGGGDGEAVVNVGFLCEYDALPAIGHACGHNLIAESGAAAALGLKAALESKEVWPVSIKVTVLGTPAEEDEGGKVDLLREGAFKDLDVVLMAHPTQKNATYLPSMAMHSLLVKYHGRASHASAYPWEGVNALDAAVMAYSNISVLRQQLRPDWRIHGIIKHGGVKPNIIPDYSELEFYFRTTSHRDLPIIRAKAEACFRAAAMATGCEVELVFAKNEFHEMLRNRILEDLYEENGKALGMKFTSEGFSGYSNIFCAR